MLTKKAFMNNMAKLDATFTNFKMLTEAKSNIAVWYDIFKLEDEAAFSNGVAHFIMTSEFIPTIAGLRKAMIEVSISNGITAEEAWKQLGIFIRNHGSYASSKQYSALDENTLKIVKSMGGYKSICHSTNPDTSRAQFMRLYRDEIEGPKQKAMSTPVLSSGIRQHILKLDTEKVEQVEMIDFEKLS